MYCGVLAHLFSEKIVKNRHQIDFLLRIFDPQLFYFPEYLVPYYFFCVVTLLNFLIFFFWLIWMVILVPPLWTSLFVTCCVNCNFIFWRQLPF